MNNNEMIRKINKSEKDIVKVNEQLEHIANKVIEVNVKDFGAKGDGITDDTNAFNLFIDYINTNKDNIYKIVVPSGVYLNNNLIEFNSLNNVIINIEGIINFTNKISSGLKFYFCSSSKITINQINGFSNDELFGNGITFINSCFIDFNINTIKDFDTGIRLDAIDLQSNVSLRGCFNISSKFEHIKNCITCIKILKTDNTAWINENRFFGGSLDGIYLIEQGNKNETSLTTTSNYNRNIFEYIGFEQAKENAITFYEGNGCIVKNCRPENPRTKGKFLIKEGKSAQSNYYDFSGNIIDLDLIELNLTPNGSVLYGDLRQNTTRVASKLNVNNNEKIYEANFMTTEKINNILVKNDSSTMGINYVFRYKDREGVIRNYLRLNRKSYTINVSNLMEGVSVPTSPLIYEIEEDNRISLIGRLQADIEISRQTNLTPNLNLDITLRAGKDNRINCVAYNYSTGDTKSVCITVESTGRLITNSIIPAGYLINFDSKIKINEFNY